MKSYLSALIKIIKDKIRFEINKRTWRNRQDRFISAIDLMQPVKGRPTAAQLTVIFRMLDIDRIREGKKSYWDIRLNECHRKLSEEEKQKFNNQFDGIVRSMDKYGWDYYLSSVIVNRDPFYMYNGTHRMAYSLMKNPFQMVPITIDNDGWGWSFEDGRTYFMQQGLSDDEIKLAEERYFQLIKDYTFDYMLLIPHDEWNAKKEMVEQTWSKYIKITDEKTIRLTETEHPHWLTKPDRKFFKDNEGKEITVIRYQLSSPDLYVTKEGYGSYTLDSILKEANITNSLYTPTISKSFEMGVWLKDNSK